MKKILKKDEEDLEYSLDIHKDTALFQKREISEIEVGKEYPVYAMVTNIISDDVDNFIIELNYTIKTKVFFLDELNSEKEKTKKNIIDRIFEPGFFVLHFTKINYEQKIDTSNNIEKDYPVEAECFGIVFGKQKPFSKEIH